jgi:hypothetical protein
VKIPKKFMEILMMDRKFRKNLVIFRANLVRDLKIARFQRKEKKSLKKIISTKNPKKFRINAGSIDD